jgi:hypothetical protein
MGLYCVLSVLFIVLVYRIISKGPAIELSSAPKGVPMTIA